MNIRLAAEMGAIPPRRSWGHGQLRVATDCSGLDAAVHALKALGQRCRHVYACEADEKCRRVLQANRAFPAIIMRNIPVGQG